MLVTLRNNYRKRTRVIVDAERRGMPVHVLRANTVEQMERFLGGLFDLSVNRAYGDSNQQIVAQTEVTLADVRLIDDRWVIKTSSGKIARADNREKYIKEFRS